MSSPRRYSIFLFIAFLALIVSGCTSAVSERPEDLGPNRGQLTLYMNGPEQASLDITFRLEAVSIVAEDGTYRTVRDSPLSVNSTAVKGRQIFLGELNLPEGKYERLWFLFSEATVARKGRTASLALSEKEIELPIDVTVEEGQNTTLFLLWGADASVVDGYLFDPALAVNPEVPEVVPLLVYVTNEDSDNVSVINRQTDKVVATVKVGRRPRGVAHGLLRERPRLYVANSGSDSVSVIDPTDNRVDKELPVRFGREPEGIAVARAAEGGEVVFVTNYGSDNVSVLDPLSGQELEKAQVGNGPIAVEVDPPVESFLESRFLSPGDLDLIRGFRRDFLHVYVVNKDSRDLSVLTWNIRRGRFEGEPLSIEVEWSPVALTVDPLRGKLYVANYGSDRLSVVDIPRLIRGETAVSIISNLGTTGTAVITDPTIDRIYLLKESPGEIMLIRPFTELEQAAFTPVLGTIPVGSSPRDLAIDPERRKLYVVNRGSNDVTVIDKTTQREEIVIPVGRRPYGVTIFPEL